MPPLAKTRWLKGVGNADIVSSANVLSEKHPIFEHILNQIIHARYKYLPCNALCARVRFPCVVECSWSGSDLVLQWQTISGAKLKRKLILLHELRVYHYETRGWMLRVTHPGYSLLHWRASACWYVGAREYTLHRCRQLGSRWKIEDKFISLLILANRTSIHRHNPGTYINHFNCFIAYYYFSFCLFQLTN